MSICAKTMFPQNCRDVKNEVFEKKIAFFFFVFFMLVQEKQKKLNGRRPKKPIKIVFFEVVIQKWEKWKKNGFLAKNCLTLSVTGREKRRAFSCTQSGLASFFLDQNSETRKNYKKMWFPRNCSKPKMTPFFKVFFDMGEKVGFTVFLKSCVLLKTLFL